MNGQVHDIDVDGVDPNHWLIGARGGGVWETRDAGTTWAATTDAQASLSVGAVAFAPGNANTIYAGVGHNSGLGVGILKSTDGGTSWQLLGTSTFTNKSFFDFTDIKVHPTNPGIVVATSRDFFGPNLSTGIFKSTDGGVTWSQKVQGVGAELEVDPSNFNNQYSGIRAVCGGCDGSLNGLYRSTSAGDSWQLISGPWGLITNAGALELAIAPSDPNVLYVTFTGDNCTQQFWRTNSAWASTPSWTQLPSNSQECAFEETIVDPINPNILYAGGVLLWKFDGTNWTNISNGIHVDQHSMAWVGTRLILGNDGGIWSTTNGGSAWANHNTNLSIVQFYLGSLHPTDSSFALGGSQDNGTEKWTGTTAWQFLFGGDGAANAISSTSPDMNWAVSFQFLGIVRTTDGGASFTAADSGIDKQALLSSLGLKNARTTTTCSLRALTIFGRPPTSITRSVHPGRLTARKWDLR